MKKLIPFIILTAFATAGSAQSDVQFTHFVFNKLAYNPGYTGSKSAFDASAIYRKQWAGIEGAPVTMNINAHVPFAAESSALGFALTTDKIGKVDATSLDLSYAYRLKLGGNHSLRLGITGRLEQVKIAWSEAEPLDTDDKAIPLTDETAYRPNFGMGAYFMSQNYFAGISAPRLLKNALYLDRSGGDISGNQLTWYFMSGFVKHLGVNVELLPSILISYNPAAPLDVDLNANLRFLESFWIGGSYRLGDSFDALAGYEFKNGLRLGMSVDFTTSELEKFSNGSYEVMMGYTFKCPNCEVKHLRFF